MGLCQEKFQTIQPEGKPEDHQWVSDSSARRTKGTPSGRQAMFNALPPGMDMQDQAVHDFNPMPESLAGETDVSDNVNPSTLRDGFGRLSMRPTDDMYTNEHCDAFYGEAKVDGDVGFVERNNMLDRI
jgi:hypothetical protein